MPYSRQTLTELRRRLLEFYNDPAAIRVVAIDANLNVGRINMGGSAVNVWHAVLEEAQKVGAINRLVNVVIDEYGELEAAMQALLGADFVRTTPPQPQPARVEQAPPASPQPAPPTPPPSPAPTVQPQPAAPALPIERPRALRLQLAEEQLLSTLFRTARRLRILTEFTDGRTATRVFLLRPTDGDGVEELPAVVKIGPHSLIEPEWQATQRHVLRRLPGFIPSQEPPVYLAAADGAIMGALRYGQVGDGVFQVESLATYLAEAGLQDSWHVIEKRLFPQLNHLWQATLVWQSLRFQHRYDGILPVNLVLTPVTAADAHPGAFRLLDGQQLAGVDGPLPNFQPDDLVQLANFVVTEIAGNEVTLNLPTRPDGTQPAYRLRLQVPVARDYQVGARVPPLYARVMTTRTRLLQQSAQAQLGAHVDLSQAELPLPDNATLRLPNPLLALPALLAREQEAKFATIHGDLNLRNILVDRQARTTHIIDCAAARQDHAIQDLLRMERDYLTDVLAGLCFQQGLPPTTIVQLYQWVHCALRGGVTNSSHFSLPAELPVALRTPFVLLVTLRRAAHTLLAQPGQWAEYYTGLILHLVGALKFRDLDNVTAGQQPKALAFWGAAALLDLLQRLNAGDDRFCREGEWRFFDLTKAEQATPRHPEAPSTAAPTSPQPTAGSAPTAERISPPTGDATPAAPPIKILFLAASPDDTVYIHAGEEARAIDLALRQAANRNFVIHYHGAVRTDDLQALLLRHNPDIVHFCGHGSQENELVFVGPTGNSVKVSGAALRQLFTVLKDNIRCIVLNACYTAEQAAALAEVIDCVIGIDDALTEAAARQFATAFYQALGYNRSIGEAFALGKNQIELAGLEEAQALQLVTRGVEAAAVNFGGANKVAAAPTGRSAIPAQRTSTPAVDTEFLQSMLAQHRRNLQLLQRQKANFGAGEEPLRLLNQIAAEEEEIGKIERQLRGE